MTAPLTVFIKAAVTPGLPKLNQHAEKPEVKPSFLLRLIITKTPLKLLKSSEMLRKGANTSVHCKWSKMLDAYLLVKSLTTVFLLISSKLSQQLIRRTTGVLAGGHRPQPPMLFSVQAHHACTLPFLIKRLHRAGFSFHALQKILPAAMMLWSRCYILTEKGIFSILHHKYYSEVKISLLK